MTIRITAAADPIKVSTIIATIYAQPGLGRTSLAFTAKNVLLLDFDHGVHRSKYRKDSVQVTSWADVQGLATEDMAPYDTIAIDTVGRMLDVLTPVIAADDKRNVQRSGQLTLQGFGALKAAAANFFERVRAAGKDIILLSHMDEQIKGDDVRERLDISGGTRNEVHKFSDAMARLYIVDGKRTLNFSPSDTAFGKNPAGFDPLVVPNFDKEPQWFAGVMGTIKDRLNDASEAARVARIELETWRERFGNLKTAGEFTAMVEQLKDKPDNVKAMLVQSARDAGLVFDREAKQFVAAGEKASA